LALKITGECLKNIETRNKAVCLSLLRVLQSLYKEIYNKGAAKHAWGRSAMGRSLMILLMTSGLLLALLGLSLDGSISRLPTTGPRFELEPARRPAGSGRRLPRPQPGYIPGQTYFGRNQYIEYLAGSLPIIISAPHGGYLEPEEIPDRSYGRTHRDPFSQEYSREVGDHILAMTCGYPHLIINRLARIKLDANREIVEAAQGDPEAEQAWLEFHAFIDAAKATVAVDFGRGHYFDFHTHIHSQEWVEIGMLLRSQDLDRSDQALNDPVYFDRSSIKSLAYSPGVYFPAVVRGGASMGGLLQARGFDSVPSPAQPHPNGRPYFMGGYNTVRHGSRDSGTIDGSQIETHPDMIADAVRAHYSLALAESILDFYEAHYGLTLRDSQCQTDEPDGPPDNPTYIIYLPIIVGG
jgi:hypothetical protein